MPLSLAGHRVALPADAMQYPGGNLRWVSTIIETAKLNYELLFPTALHIADLADPTSINQRLLDAVSKIRGIEPNSKPQSWACDLYTTIGNPSLLMEHLAFQDLLRLFQQQLIAYAENHSYKVEAPRITECWLNVYKAGDAQEIHLHRNSMVSGIYYVSVPEGAGATLFYSPWADVMLSPQATEANQLNATVSGIEPEAGRVVLFRSALRHSVMPGQFDGERVTIAFNAML